MQMVISAKHILLCEEKQFSQQRGDLGVLYYQTDYFGMFNRERGKCKIFARKFKNIK